MRKISFIPMNLQLFAEDSGVGGGTAAPQTETTSTESTESTTATTELGEATGSETDTQSSDTDLASQKVVQTPEQNAAFAELRRSKEAAERKAAQLEAQRQRDIEVARKYGKDYGIYSDDDVAAKYGQSHGLKTVAEFEEALQREEYQAKGIDPDMIKKIIDDHPAIQRAREQEQAFMKAQEENFLVNNFNELTKEYPEITKPEDVPADVWKKWQSGKTGLSLVEAYYVANRKAISAKQVDAAKQATLNNLQGKSHIKGNGSGTEVDTTSIPDDVLEMYKKFNPGKTLDEYKKHYKASLK